VLLLDERILADGTHVRCWGSASGERLHLRDDAGNERVDGALSITAVDRVMRRYGRPLEAPFDDAEHLELGAGFRLSRFRFHAVVDATGRDYLIWERPDGEPLAAIATMVTAALRYLVLRITAEDPSGN
jgi:hypothetical protein